MPYVEIGKTSTDVWPPDDEESKERLQNYLRLRLLFKGRHQEVFERIQSWIEKSNDKSIVYIVCNFAGLISKVSADMLFGEKLKYVVGAKGGTYQEQLDRLVENNNLNSLNYEMGLSASWRGEVIYKIRWEEFEDGDNRSIIEPASPACFWPILNEDNVKDLKGGVFGHIKKGPDLNDERRYLKIERHLPGSIENELWLLNQDGRTIKDQVALNTFEEYAGMSEKQETGYPGLLFHYTPNWRLEDSFWGISDYYDLEGIFDEINNRVSRISRVLDKHESPRLILPPGIMQFDEKTQRWYIEKEDFEALEIPGNDETVRDDLPKYLTWDAELNAAFTQLEKLIELAFYVSETSPDAFGMNQGGVAESGRALKFRLIRTLAKVNRKKIYFDEAIKSAIMKALTLEAEYGNGKDPEDFNLRLEWADGIPDDPMEQATIENIRTGNAPTTSIRSAVRRLDDLDGEALDQELEEISFDQLETGQTPIPDERRGLDLFGDEDEE